MIIKDELLVKLALFCKKAEGDKTNKERSDTIENTAEEIVKLFSLHFVSNRRELLIAFFKFLATEMDYTTETDYTPGEQVDVYLESNL